MSWPQCIDRCGDSMLVAASRRRGARWGGSSIREWNAGFSLRIIEVVSDVSKEKRMKAKSNLGWWLIAGVLVAMGGGWLTFRTPTKPAPTSDVGAGVEKLQLADEEWRQRLTAQQFAVLREEATERAGTSPLNHEKRTGVFVCAGCGPELFGSGDKYESGTGWPSFCDVIAGHVTTRVDRRLFLPRTEYHCTRCGGHQGHVFNDGPAPKGLRYCSNGVALRFVPDDQPQP